MYGINTSWEPKEKPRIFFLEDYKACEARWCAGCGDLAILNAVRKLARDEQMKPESTVFVSGIGCSSRFPHYMKTYGFHGLHGRALPIASGIRSRRPDLNMFVITGDGDCTAIGAGHWIHAIRYNMNMTVLLFDNNVYGLTKKQSSPTSGKGFHTNTHPEGTFLSPLNPLSVVLGVTNASFVAQTVDWNPPHLYATIKAAHEHHGLSFVRIMQRCPHFHDDAFTELQNDPSKLRFLKHEAGIQVDEQLLKMFPTVQEHDPSDLAAAKALVMDQVTPPLGLLYQDLNSEHYDDFTVRGMGMSPEEKIAGCNTALDGFAV